MMRRKNLERAIVLGLLLSTSVYGSVWAESIEEFKEGAVDSVITVTEDTIVTGTKYYGPDVSAGSGVGGPAYILNNSLFERPNKDIVNMTITAGNVQLTFENVNMLSPHIIRAEDTNGADIQITNKEMTTDTANSNKDFAGINVSAIIEANSLIVDSMGRGIYTGVGKNEYPIKDVEGKEFFDVKIDVNNQVKITSASDGIFNEGNGESDVNITAGSVYIENADRNGIYNAGQATDLGNNVTISVENGDITIISNGTGDDQASVKNKTEGKTELTASGSINLTGANSGVWATKGEVSLTSNNGNYIRAKDAENNIYGKGLGIYAEGASNVNLNAAAGDNELHGAISATGADTSVTLAHNSVIRQGGSGSNNIYSAVVIDGAGDLDSKEKGGMDVVSALYAEEGAEIKLSGVNDIRTYYGDPNDEHTSERAVWAYKGANITLDGTTNISTYKYEVSPENRDIAIAAGTATELKEEDFKEDALSKVEIASVNLNYQAGSSISGDILAAYGGEVNIKDNNITTASVGRNSGATGINITGDLLAGNTGKLTVDLGNGGSLTGRADDYGDASTEHITLYNPAFSSNIIQGGDVTLNMGDGSQWNVQGQSWITNVNANGNVLIDLTSAENEYKNYDSHALTIRNLNGDANIKMDLNGDRSQSDMLYIGQGNGEYNIELAELVTVDDMYANLDDNTKFSGLRFATVGAGSDVKFNVTAKDQGFNNVIYTVDTDVYNSAESAHENDAYNGENMTEEKPGNSLVDDLLNGKQNASTESGIATLAANDVMLLADENNTENDNKTQHLNYKLVDMQSDGPTDAGKTMLNMSRANYSNAIYMDRLNKRLGEARYINDKPEEDEGMWVRIRHDRIGKEDAFRSQNTMYELGYDKRQECDNGKRRVGFAVDYMHGDTGYSDIAGKGEIDRYGLWLYDTWTGNKGHYADYVAKWGHLQNDFEVYTMTGGEKVTGDYSNNVFSISAEYGRKKDMGNDWYIEPQAQLQLARVTGADYTTSQGTKVSVDGINSLIGRAGFRLGKDFGEEKQSTVYFKADVLHEFLGDQTIRAMDGTTDGWQTVDYENKGTWYDIGIGYAAMLSQSTYAFIDLEQSFGNDNDDTYQINAGVRWTF